MDTVIAILAVIFIFCVVFYDFLFKKKESLEVHYCDWCKRRVEHKKVYTGEKRRDIGLFFTSYKDGFRLICGNCHRESMLLLESKDAYKNSKRRKSDKPVIKYSEKK